MELRSVREFERWRTRRYKQYINCKGYFKKYICTDFICSFAHGFHVAKPVFLYLSLTCLTSRKVNSCTSKLDSSTSSQESTVRTPPNRVRVDIIVINCVNLGVQTEFYHPFWWRHRLQGPFLSLSSLELDDLSVSWKIWDDFEWKIHLKCGIFSLVGCTVLFPFWFRTYVSGHFAVPFCSLWSFQPSCKLTRLLNVPLTRVQTLCGILQDWPYRVNANSVGLEVCPSHSTRTVA